MLERGLGDKEENWSKILLSISKGRFHFLLQTEREREVKLDWNCSISEVIQIDFIHLVSSTKSKTVEEVVDKGRSLM